MSKNATLESQHQIMPVINYDYQDKNLALTNFTLGMYNKTLTMFDYTNLPDSIPFKEVEKIIQQQGYAIIAEYKGELYAFRGGLSGYDAYYQPTQAVISNPYLGFSATLEIGTECVIIRNDDMRLGLHYLFQRYGNQIIENELTMIVNNFNSRMKTIITATDDNTAESAKEYLQDVEDGKTGVVMGSKLFDGIKIDNPNHNTSSNVSDLIELEQYMKATLYNEIGLDANYNMKRERLTDGEVNQNDDALYPLIDNMLDNRIEGWQEVNKLFNTNVSVDFSSIWKVKQQELESHIANVTKELEDDDDGDGDDNTIDSESTVANPVSNVAQVRESLEDGREDVIDKLDIDAPDEHSEPITEESDEDEREKNSLDPDEDKTIDEDEEDEDNDKKKA